MANEINVGGSNAAAIYIGDTLVAKKEEMSQGLFQENADTFHLDIPSGVTGLCKNCLAYRSSMSSVTIPESVTLIDNYAFSNCYSLESVTIPSGVTNIGSQAFINCSGLTAMTFEGTTPPTLGSYALGNTNSAFPIYVPDGASSAYTADSSWSNYTSRVTTTGETGTSSTSTVQIKYLLPGANSIEIYSDASKFASISYTNETTGDGPFEIDLNSGENMIDGSATESESWEITVTYTLTSTTVEGGFGSYAYIKEMNFGDDVEVITDSPFGMIGGGEFMCDDGETIDNVTPSITVGTGITYIGSSVFEIDPLVGPSFTFNATTPPTIESDALGDPDDPDGVWQMWSPTIQVPSAAAVDAYKAAWTQYADYIIW